MSKINNQAEVWRCREGQEMSAVVYPDFLSYLELASLITRLPAACQENVMRVASKAAAGCLGDDDLHAVVERVRAGVLTVDEGLAELAAAH